MEVSIREQLSDVQQEVKLISRQLIELTAVHNMVLDERKSNLIKIERLETDFLSAKGAIALLKMVIGLFGASIIAFCTWIVTSNNEQQKEIYMLNQRVAVLQEKRE